MCIRRSFNNYFAVAQQTTSSIGTLLYSAIARTCWSALHTKGETNPASLLSSMSTRTWSLGTDFVNGLRLNMLWATQEIPLLHLHLWRERAPPLPFLPPMLPLFPTTMILTTGRHATTPPAYFLLTCLLPTGRLRSSLSVIYRRC